MKQMKQVASTPEETKKIACEILSEVIKKRKKNHATIIALCGELGSGKTAFTRGIAEALGVKESVVSPTFILERVYRIKKGSFKRLVHIDCYRFEDALEAKALGWAELVKDPHNLIVVEWAEKVEKLLPPHTVKVCLEHVSESGRSITINQK